MTATLPETLSEPLTLNATTTKRGCLFCGTPLTHTFVDLGKSPLCESYLSAEQLDQMEPFYPLHVYVCAECYLVQLKEYVSGEEIFTEYAYFSSYSDSWLAHARRYTDQMIDQFGLTASSHVVEVASNDGYLLQYVKARGIPCIGVEGRAGVLDVMGFSWGASCARGPTLSRRRRKPIESRWRRLVFRSVHGLRDLQDRSDRTDA